MHINSLSEYNELAKAYDIFKRDDNYPAFFSLLKGEFIDVCKLGRDVHSLEVGCGTGTFTHLFNEAGFNIDGVDISPNMISVAQNKYPDLPDLLYWVDKVSFKNQTCYACISNSLPTIRVGPIFDPSKSLCYQKYENALEQKWPEVKEYERVANSFEYNKSATPWACYSAASILVGQIIQKLLTGHSTLDGKTFLLNLETLVARKGIEI